MATMTKPAQLPLEAEVETPGKTVARSNGPSTPATQGPTGVPAHALQASSNVGSILDLMKFAIENKVPAEQMKEFVILHERVADRAAAQDFALALAAFQQECPSVKKKKEAKFATRGGGEMEYTYADLPEIVRVVRPILAKHGLSFTWDTVATGDKMTVTCTLRHVNGHAEKSSLTLPTTTNAAMSDQQKYGAAMTFAQRRTLSAVLGITTEDDTDTATAEDITPISEDQITVIHDLISERTLGKSQDRRDAFTKRFLNLMNVRAISEIPQSRYERAVAMLTAKADAQKGGK